MKKLFLIFLFTVGGALIFMNSSNRNNPKILKVGIPGAWKDLVPSLQHTAFADYIMHNQFEPLVVVGRNGTTQPMAAESWSISDDFRVFTFRLSGSKKFSNGTKLTASHFKQSWEHSLTIDSKSANNSLLDVLYKLRGFDDYEKTGTISGIQALDDLTLQLTFKKPFRMALAHLSGTRMAAFIENGGEFYGTGPYVIDEVSGKELILSPNPFSTEETPFSEVHLSVIEAKNSQEALRSGKIDLYTFAELAQTDSCGQSNLKCVSGSENRHQTLILNGIEGRLFNDPRHRKAFQYLLLSNLKESDLPQSEKAKTQIDPQIYLPLQAGRIETSEAQSIIDEGKQYVDEFLKHTKKSPLLFAFTETSKWLKPVLSKSGVHISSESPQVTRSEIAEMYYKNHTPDILVGTMSVASGDPDGLYHALGKQGSISSPMLHRNQVSDLLEEGRKLLNPSEISEHYQKVSRSALREVPFVHIGFLKSVVILNSDRIEISQDYLKREDGRFVDFRPVDL